MGEIEPVTYDMVQRNLEDSEIKYLRAQDGAFVAIYGATPDRSELHVSFVLEGDNEVLVLRVQTPEVLALGEEDSLARLMNEWNRLYRWPKAFTARTTDDSAVRVFVEFQLPVAAGIHMALLSEVTHTTIRTGDAFFRWLDEQRKLPSVEQLETWFKQAS